MDSPKSIIGFKERGIGSVNPRSAAKGIMFGGNGEGGGRRRTDTYTRYEPTEKCYCRAHLSMDADASDQIIDGIRIVTWYLKIIIGIWCEEPALSLGGESYLEEDLLGGVDADGAMGYLHVYDSRATGECVCPPKDHRGLYLTSPTIAKVVRSYQGESDDGRGGMRKTPKWAEKLIENGRRRGARNRTLPGWDLPSPEDKRNIDEIRKLITEEELTPDPTGLGPFYPDGFVKGLRDPTICQ